MTSKTAPNRDLEKQKLMAFPLEEYWVALPLETVLRVLRHTPSEGDDKLHRMGLLQIGRHVLRVLNLHRWLSAAPSPTPSFLILARSPQGEPFGLWTDGLPDLIEVSPDLLRSLPPSAGVASGFLDLMSHAAVVSDAEAGKTIFLLNVARALGERVPEVAALPSA